MIQIDDAGSGSLIGGTCIGIYDTQKDIYIYDIIPLSLYNDEKYNSKAYLYYIIDIVKSAFSNMRVNKRVKIQVCRGYMFDKLRQWLTENNYNWENTQITGNLQELVEKSFCDYAISLGFPAQYIQYTKYPFHFHRILRWVYADFENRSKLCKTGWDSWKKYCSIPVKISIGTLDKESKYHCLKCGKVLNPRFKIKVLEYTSNAPNKIYLHPKCCDESSFKNIITSMSS